MMNVVAPCLPCHAAFKNTSVLEKLMHRTKITEALELFNSQFISDLNADMTIKKLGFVIQLWQDS
jgi:hypothetical protein